MNYSTGKLAFILVVAVFLAALVVETRVDTRTRKIVSRQPARRLSARLGQATTMDEVVGGIAAVGAAVAVVAAPGALISLCSAER